MKNTWIFDGMNQEKTIDYAVSFEHNEFIVDIFDAKIADNNRAYIETLCFDSLTDVKTDMKSFVYPR